MAAPSFSDLIKYAGKKLTDTDWNFNFQTVVNWLNGTTKIDTAFGNVTADTATITTLTATNISGNGSAITNIPGLPIGALVEFAGAVDYANESTKVPNFLYADGRSLLKTGTYANLFAVIGTTFGSEDSNHFNIPDFRQMFSRTVGMADTVFNNTVDTTNDIITVTAGHYINRTGMQVRVKNSGGALPTGLNNTTTYWARVLSSTTFSLYDTYANAINTGSVTGRIDLTANGTGTNTIYQYDDPDASIRTSLIIGGATGNSVGSWQDDAFESHTHAVNYFNYTSGGGANGLMAGTGQFVGSTGGTETRPKNIYVTRLIRYQ